MSADDRIFDALHRTLRGDDGELHADGKTILKWLEGVCHYGDSPLDEAHYNGDLILHGRVLGKQEVFSRIIEAMNIPPSMVRAEQVESAVRAAQFETGEIDDA